MMSHIDILKSLIHDKALVHPRSDTHNQYSIILSEGSKSKPNNYSITLRDVPLNTIAFKADSFPVPQQFFKCTRGICKRADFVVIVDDKNDKWIIYIEMKRSELLDLIEIEQQLRGAKCLVEYCRSIGQEFWSDKKFLDFSYHQRFVCIQITSLNIRSSRAMRGTNILYDTPEDMFKTPVSPGGSVFFNQLIK